MGDLQPLGSEKLQGMDKIQRILEISRFRENTPSSINETSKSEYSLTLADGNEYNIVREKTGYIIKQTISESSVDYLAPIQDRQYFKSYSQALRKLNLMAKDMNEIYGNEQGTSLFSEQKKFVLKTPEKKNTSPTDDVENIPAPAPMAPAPMAPAPMAPSPTGDEDMSMGDDEIPTDDMGDDEMPTDDMGMDDEEGTTEPVGDNNDDTVTFKLIQKLTGKLGQKLRVLNTNEEDEMSSKDIKYVINSILSALDLENLDEEDKEDIMNKFEGVEADEEDDFGNDFDPSSDEEEEGGEEEEEPIGFGDMDGSYSDLGKDIAMKTMMKAMTPGQFNEEDDDDSHIGRIADSLFMEAKVEDVLIGYFNISEGEKKFNSKIGKTRLEQKKNQKSKRNLEIKRLSESLDQEIASRKFLNENKSASFVGKTNKKNLVFETNNKQIKVTPKGRII